MPRPRVLLGLSGGVDSAVAAVELLQAGFQVEALFMKNWEDDDEPGYCAAEADLAMAREVAAQLEIPLHKANYAHEYHERVFAEFLAEYAAGRTPNPDILCNREIKFPALLDQALLRGADYVATGHYARVEHTPKKHRLLLAADANKDQTYFLHRITQQQLSKALFPLGTYQKTEVRQRARDWGLSNHARRDSTGICFIGERRFREFLARYLSATEGPICTETGQVVGRHIGLMFYTLGQRQGLGIGGVSGAAEAPWFVVAKDLTKNRLFVAQGGEHPWLVSDALRTETPHWLSPEPPHAGAELKVRIRHRQPLQSARLRLVTSDSAWVDFAQPQRAVTPGQSIVFYRDQECLGGAVIAERSPEPTLPP